VTVITLLPLESGIPDTLQFVVPVATPLAPRSLAHLTCDTPTLSDAEPPRAIDDEVVEKVVPVVGVPIDAVGGVVSPAGAVMAHVNGCDAAITPSVTLTVTEYVPAVVPAPEMNPVLAIRAIPGGSPLALYVSGSDAGSEPTNCNVTA
jgi:hypothetical protein